LAALGGCTALPTIVPDMAWPSKPVRVNGGRGPLSLEQSKAVLESLKTRPGETSILDRHLAIEEAIVGSPLVAGNKVVLLQDGPRTYAAMLAAIRAARHHINFETYIIEEDEIGRRFADLLIAKQRQGVQVNLLYDSVGTIKTPREFFERLAATGVKTLEYNPVNPLRASAGWDVNQRDHRKLLVIDGRIAFLGGINISSVYSGSSLSRGSMSGSSRAARDPNKPAGGLPWRDTHLQVEGPVVADFRKLFVETWRKQKGPALDTATFFPTLGRRGKDVSCARSPARPTSRTA
jgi:cardiolipin synthase